MRDLYAMNRETGEIIPCTAAIRLFYQTHGALEAWTDEWLVTNEEVEESELEAPNFNSVF